ncbi:MAG: BatA and WFA domain-containing protein [Polyangia bacterium]
MHFLAPSLLFGLLAAFLPWLVHLIGKRRAQPVRFAAMQLLLRSERRISARRRLREILLLVARTGVAAALPLIFARPFAERTTDLPVASLDAQSAVIVLDDSASMSRSAGLSTMFERARDRARALLRQFPSDVDLALLVASAGSSPKISELSPERARVLEALESTVCSARPADYASALRSASLILAGSVHVKRRIYLFTDLQAAGWEAGTGLPAEGAAEVIIDDVSRAAPWENRAALEVSVVPAPEVGTGGIAVDVELADFSAAGARALGVALNVDGVSVAKGFVDLAPGGRGHKRFLHRLGDGGGTHDVEVEIDGDAFRLDDHRLAHVELARTMSVLVVNGDPRTTRNEDEPFFFAAALRNGLPGAAVTTKLPDDVTPESLNGTTLVALLNLAQPSQALAAALARFVSAGGGLFISVGDRVDTTIWNERMAKLLPQPLGLPRTASALPGQHAGEIVDDRPAERLAPIDRSHPLLANFPERGEGLVSARFFKYMLLDPAPESPNRSVILRYESGAPALVEKQVGKGRVMLLSTTVDREWTDLPIHTGFLPLVREAARRLVGVTSDEETASLRAGEARTLVFAGDDQRLEVSRPDGSVWVARRDQASAAGSVLYSETDRLGTYHVRAVGPDGTVVARPELDFVVNLDTRESNPARLDPAQRPDRIAVTSSGAKPPKHRVELWHSLAAVMIGLLLCESLLTLRRRRA